MSLASVLPTRFAPETKRAPAPLALVTPTGLFEGYASLFGVADLGRDVVARGAFADSLRRRGPEGVKMLWSHDPTEPVGAWLALREDGSGLHVRGRLNLAVARAREILALMRAGAVDGLSIGFRTRRATTDRATGLRTLHAIDLWEISIVAFPMLPGARVVATRTEAKRAPKLTDLRRDLARLQWRKDALLMENALRRGFGAAECPGKV